MNRGYGAIVIYLGLALIAINLMTSQQGKNLLLLFWQPAPDKSQAKTNDTSKQTAAEVAGGIPFGIAPPPVGIG